MTTEPNAKLKTKAQAKAELAKIRALTRKQQLNELITAILPKGDYSALYRDVAECYRALNLTVPVAFTIFLGNKEYAEKLAELTTDKRVFVKYSAKLEAGKVTIVPQVR